jgi:3-phosphoglycerate kinase
MVDPLPTLDELGVDGRRVLLPADLNLPLEQGPTGAAVAVAVADDTRIRAALLELLEGRQLTGVQALVRTAAVR